jgi:hypothetical protein
MGMLPLLTLRMSNVLCMLVLQLFVGIYNELLVLNNTFKALNCYGWLNLLWRNVNQNTLFVLVYKYAL